MFKCLKLLTGFASVLIVVACGGPGYVSGDGSMHSLGGLKEASLKFSANSCDGIENSEGKIKMKDKAAIDWEAVGGVKFKGDVDETYFCFGEGPEEAPLCACQVGYQEIRFSYDSTNNKAPGSGDGIACMADIGNDDSGSNEGGLSGIAEIFIASGPYEGYHNVGATDVTQHDCNAAN